MIRIAAIGCIHNDIENLPALLDKLFSHHPKILISVGDITDSSLPKGFSPIDIGKIFIEEVRYYTQNLLIVPGSWDKSLIDLIDKENVSLHGKGKIIDNIGFYGFGGAKTPFNTPFEPEENEIEEGLKNAYEHIKNTEIKIQATHAPPFQTTLDIVGNKHVGSLAVRKIIENFKPRIAVCSHIHESAGKDSINSTVVINVGKFVEGHTAIIDIKNESIEVEIINLI
ncbi:MAG: metallophosphoesterase [Candidatus Aenigmatarchaeota archaeon]